MQRITENQNGTIFYTGRHARCPGLDSAGTMKVAAQREVMQKLAEYEDTGLEPEQIRQLIKEAACGQYTI